MNARCFFSSRWRGMTSGLRYSSPRRCRSATSPERLSYSTPNSDPIKAPISRVERGEAARTHATSFSCCASLRTQALPPASNRISAFRPPSANAPCQRRIVSSSSKRTRATCSQLRPSSSNTSALARRANRCVTDPSRASAISAERSSPNKNPGRIMPSNESNSTPLARAFRLPNESGYTTIPTASLLRRHGDSLLPDRFDEGPVVAEVLIGVFDREFGDRVMEGRIRSQVTCNARRIARSRMGPRQRPAAKPAVLAQHADVPVLDDGGNLGVAKLAQIVIAAVPTARPANEDVARQLHEPLASHDPLAVDRVPVLAGVGLEHGLPRLLDLQEDRVVLGRHEQSDGAIGANAADAHDLDLIAKSNRWKRSNK